MWISVIAFWIKKAEAHDLDRACVINFCAFYRSFPQIPCCMDKENPCDVPRGEVMGVQTPRWSFNLFFNCVCTKILSKLCCCIYEIQKFCAGKRKKLYSIFTFCFSLLALPLDPTWGLLPSRRPGSTHSRQFVIYISCETPPLRSPGYAYGATHPNLHPLKAPQTHCGNVRSPHVGYCSSCYFHKIMSWISHQNGINAIKIAV